MDKEYWEVIIFVGIVILVFGLIVGMRISYDSSAEKACKEIGMEKYVYRGENYYCQDYAGNLHYIDMNCEGTLGKCTAKEISVGGVRVANG
jgi:hypothetical protein